MPEARSFYQAESGYHATQLAVSERAFELMARERARKLQPLIAATARVIEYGVGTGLNLAAVECGIRVGYDVADHLRAEVERRGIEFASNMTTLGGGSFDVALSHHSLEHTPDPGAALDEIRRVLAPGGRLLLFVPYEKEPRYREFRRDEPNHHLYSWNPQTLANLVATRGFVVECAGCGPTGYERFAGEWIARLGLGDRAFRAALALLRSIRLPEEVRLIARNAA